MQRNRYDHAAGEWLTFKAFFEKIAQRLRQRDAIGVLQVMDDFAESLRKQDCGTGKVEGMLACSA